MQKLKIYQSLWAMEQRRPDHPERSVAENFAMIAEAGYDGVCLDPSVIELPGLAGINKHYAKYNLGCMVNAFPHAPDDMRELLAFAVGLEACIVNVISGVMPLTPQEAVPTVQRWIAEAEQAGVPLLFETHRDGLLNDLFFTLQLMDAVPEMRLCADLSHFVVDREMRAPIPAIDEERIHSILDRSDCFQGRIASREQIQIQIDFPQHQLWVQIFKNWWKDGMRSWRRRHGPDETLVFLCELGPPPYAITDGQQRELSDRWQEALQIREWARDIWCELDEEEAAA